jgi:ATP-dependent helicase HrpB
LEGAGGGLNEPTALHVILWCLPFHRAQVSSATRVEVVTEGILLRRLQRDPGLEGVGAVLLDEVGGWLALWHCGGGNGGLPADLPVRRAAGRDRTAAPTPTTRAKHATRAPTQFHERNLDADLALALCLDAQRWTRPDLRLLVMSATLGGGLAEDVRDLMRSCRDGEISGDAAEGEGAAEEGGVPIVVSEGRSYPVQTVHLGAPSEWLFAGCLSSFEAWRLLGRPRQSGDVGHEHVRI